MTDGPVGVDIGHVDAAASEDRGRVVVRRREREDGRGARGRVEQLLVVRHIGERHLAHVVRVPRRDRRASDGEDEAVGQDEEERVKICAVSSESSANTY